ncbi:hypothetical protein K7432_018482 [Basidiobolus ranarum]|uniref:Uncharacterized protein n=1 Tax=Basidiobolus ranarum TaxID=34480 RepID=A0ABR2VIY7_9FUNG
MFLNKVLRKKEKIEKLTQDTKNNSYSEEEIKTSVKASILDVCDKIRVKISSRTVPTAPANFLDGCASNSKLFGHLPRQLQVGKGLCLLRRQSKPAAGFTRILYAHKNM